MKFVIKKKKNVVFLLLLVLLGLLFYSLVKDFTFVQRNIEKELKIDSIQNER